METKLTRHSEEGVTMCVRCATCRIVVLTTILVLSLTQVNARAATFTPLGDFGSVWGSQAWSVSRDGSVVVGRAAGEFAGPGFLWTSAGGMVSIPGNPHDVSADGRVVVGHVPEGGNLAFRWTAANGLSLLDSVDRVSGASAASADGSIIVGGYGGQSPSNYRWTAQSGMVPFAGDVTDLSGDGSVSVGTRNFGNGPEASRTSMQGIAGLGDLPGGDFESDGLSISYDGTTIVGWSSSATAREAFRWTASGGMQGLGLLPDKVNSVALAVSDDGSVVIGVSGARNNSFLTGEPFYWAEQTGMLSLRDLLISQGVSNLDGWQLSRARDVSGDGRTIVGTGVNPAGKEEAWVATLSPVPEPAALVMVAVGLVAVLVGVTHRRHRRAAVC